VVTDDSSPVAAEIERAGTARRDVLATAPDGAKYSVGPVFSEIAALRLEGELRRAGLTVTGRAASIGVAGFRGLAKLGHFTPPAAPEPVDVGPDPDRPDCGPPAAWPRDARGYLAEDGA
jgi:hypothetical protein